MYSELSFEAIRKADALCDTDPIQAAVRTELLSIHEHISPSMGVDAAEAWLYQVVVNERLKVAESLPMDMLTRVVRYFTAAYDGNLPMVLNFISMLLSDPTASHAPVDDTVLTAIHLALNTHELADGWEFYGIGVCSGAMCVSEKSPDAEEYAMTGRISEHPDAHPVWYAKLVGCDMRVWSILAEQGEPLVYSVTDPDEVELEQAQYPMGTSLMRLLIAKTGG